MPLARRVLRDVLRRSLAGDDCRTAVEIALGEACGNAVRHADPATHYDLHLRVQNGTCLVEVADAGTGFALHQEPTMPAANTVSGRGLAIIAEATDELDVQPRHPSGTLLRFVKHLYG
ncbi:ATP-binding protein [Phytohabitans sp. LJ34]|uniref:ATP-binding protein n=1 Tax=Phytohabitans sp. LJ34 TaxID=3452217 RepID=UPI003F8A2241